MTIGFENNVLKDFGKFRLRHNDRVLFFIEYDRVF